MRIKLHLLLFSLVVSTWVHAQDDLASIDLVAFNSSINYGAGSGITVHFNPRGVFKFEDEEDAANDNQFFLELSDTNGNFPGTTLETVNGFFVTNINTVIPTGTPGSTNYNIRVRASKGLTATDPLTYDNIFSDEAPININSDWGLDPLILYSTTSSSNGDNFNCSNQNQFDSNPMFGSLVVGATGNSSIISLPQLRRISISNYNSSSQYLIKKIDVINNTVEDLGVLTSEYYQIPDDIPIGTYNYEIQEFDTVTGLTSVYTIVLILHDSKTVITVIGAQSICTEKDVTFEVITTNQGVGQNYRGAYYTINFGDGTDVEIFTHAEILNDPNLIHNYNLVSCNIEGALYIVDKSIYNKFTRSDESGCNYQEIGNGTTVAVNTSKAPEALFESTDSCETENLIAINQTTLGQYGGPDGCGDDANFFWTIIAPDGTEYETNYINGSVSGQNWLSDYNGDGLIDLVIPESDIFSGCWEIRMEATNQNFCMSVANFPALEEDPYIVNVQAVPQSDFQFLDSSGPQENPEICFGETLRLENLTNTMTDACYSATYNWVISSDTGGYAFIDSDASSESPEVLFEVPGVYDVTLEVISACGNFPSETKSVTVYGDPTVEFPDPASLAVCENDNQRLEDGFTLDFNTAELAPIYSTVPFEVANFTWTISGGSGATSDYSFTSGTDLSSANPVINFSEFGDYIISVEVGGRCSVSNTAVFSFVYDQTPLVTNSIINQDLCTGSLTQQIDYSSDMDAFADVSYEYQLITEVGDPNGYINGYEGQDFTTGIPLMELINDSNFPAFIAIDVTPSVDGCPGETVRFTIFVSPSIVIGDETILECTEQPFTFNPEDISSNIVPNGTTYTWSVANIPDEVSGVTNASSPQEEISQTLVNNSNIVQTVIYNVTASLVGGSCPDETFEVTVQVNPVPIIADVVEVICSGADFEVTPVNGGGSNSDDIVPSDMTYTWTVEDLSGQISGDSDESAPQDSISQTLINDSNIPQIVTYTVIPTYDFAAANCQGAPFEVEVTVNPTPVIPTQNDEICSGETFVINPTNSLPNTIVPSGTTYVWTVEDNLNVTGETSESSPQAQISQTLVNNSNIVQTVIYTVIPTSGADGLCVGAEFTVTVDVNPVPIIADVVEVICSGADFEVTPVNGGGSNSDDIVPSDMTYTWTVEDLSGQISGDSDESAPQDSISQTLINDSNIPQIVTYTVIPTYDFAAANCQGAPFEVEVTVNPTPVIPTQNDEICSGETFVINPTNSLPNTIVPSGTTYVWTVEDNLNVTGETSESSPQAQISQTLVNNSNIVQTVIYTVIPTSGADGLCVGAEFTVTVDVNPVPIIADVVEVICSGADFEVTPVNGGGSNSDDIVPSDMTYTWTVEDLSGQISGDSDESAPKDSISQTLINDSNILQIVTYTVIPTYDFAAANCQGAPFEVEVTVNPEPTMDAVDAQSICGGTAFDSPDYVSDVSGVSYAWELTSTTIPTDITGYPSPSGAGELSGVTIQNGGDNPFTLVYDLTVFYEGCEGNTVPFSITINPSPVVNITPAVSQSICIDGTANFETLNASYIYSEPITDISYQWYYNTTDSNEIIGAVAVGTNDEEYTPVSEEVGTRYYFSVLSFNPNVCDDVTSNTVEIIVEDSVLITAHPRPTQTICVGGEISGMSVAYSGGSGTPEYQWFEGTFPSGVPLPNSNFPDLELDPDYFSTPGTFDFYATISFPATSGCDQVISDAGTVEVLGDPILTAPLATQTVCQDSTPQDLGVTASGGAGSTYSYQWYDAATDQPIVGATFDTFTPPTSVVGTFSYYAVVVTDASGCETQSATSELIVSQGPSIDSQPIANQTLCLNGTPEVLSVSYTDGVGVPSYQWYASATCDTTDLSSPVGTDAPTFTPSTVALGSINYFVVLTFPSAGGCDAIVSDCADVEVVEDPVVTVESDPPTPICEGGEIDDMEVRHAGGVGTPTYTWYVSDASGLNLTPIAGSNSATYNPGIFATAGLYFYVAEVTFNENPNNGCDIAYSNVITVEVVGDPILTAPLATQTVCQDSTPQDLGVMASGGAEPTYSYQWYDAATDQPIVGATFDTFTPPTSVVGTFSYYAVVVTDASGCETQSASAEIIVEPAPSISTQPLAEQNLCQFETITDLEVLYANGIGTPTYQWYQSTTCDTTDLSTPVGTDAPIFSPPANTGTFYYFAELSFSEGGCGSIFSECSKVEITPLAFIPDPDPVEIPDETSFIFGPQDGSVPDLSTIVPAGTTYTWTFVPNPNISGANSFSEIDFPNGTGAPNAFDSGVLNNINPTFTQLETIVFQVTPWTNGCNGTPFDITITVAAAPEINEVITNQPCYYQDQLCEASIEISPVGFGPFTYNWVYLTDPSLPLPNPTDRDQFDLCSGFYQLTISDALNYSYQYEFEVVLPDPLLFNLVALTEISCNNTNTFPCDGSIEVSTSGGELPYSLVEWYTETIPDSGVFDSGPFVNNINPNELLNVCEGNYVLKILDANGCEYVSDIYTIAEAVDPIIITETLSDYNGFNIHCNAANSGTITIDLSGGSGVFDYTFVADATGTVLETDTIFNPPATLVFSALTAGDYTFTIEDPNCTDQIVRNFTLTQPNELIITATLVDAIDCFGGLATYDVIATGGVPPYTGTGLQNVPSGPVTFIVSDANDGFGGCQDDFSTIVFEPVELLATHNFNDALCYGDTGQITVTPTGGTGILTVNLYDNTNTFITSINTTQGSSVTFDQLAGTYFYDVVDQNNCPPYGPQVIVIDEPNPIDVIVTRADDPNCASSPEWEFNNGSICITITGGTNPYPEPSFDLNGSPLNWVDNGGGEWCLNNLSLSPVDLDWEYPIVVTDDNGCLPAIPTVDVPLTRPSEISASFTYDPQIFDCPSNTVSQSVSVSISGGVPPYIVNWQGPEVNLDLTNQFVMTATASGNYMALVNDQHGIANGCPPIEFPLDPIIFYEFANAEFNYESGNNDFCGLFSISDPISFNIVSTGDIVNSEWDFGDGSSTVSNVESPTHVYDEIGTYIITLTVTDPYGCMDENSYPIEITKGYEIVLPTAFTPNADGINDNIRPVYNCMTQVEMIIYDTWGSLLYTETGENIIGWDGTIDGSPAENGNYIMVVRAQAFNGVVVDLNGPITLLK